MTCDEDPIVEKNVDGRINSSIDCRLSQANINRPLPNCHKRIRSIQLLQFDKSPRHAFYGVWPTKSQVVKACRPLAKDPDIDYEIDSGKRRSLVKASPTVIRMTRIKV